MPGLNQARVTCQKSFATRPLPAFQEWLAILERPWEDVREVLLDGSETGNRREKDLVFVTAILQHGLISSRQIQSVFGELDLDWVERIRSRLTRCEAGSRGGGS